MTNKGITETDKIYQHFIKNHFPTGKGTLITIGALPGMGLTSVSIKIANYLASDNKVLFFSYQELKSNLERLIEKQGDTVSLATKTDAPFWSDGFYQRLEQQILENQLNYVFIDDLDNFLDPQDDYDDQFLRSRIIEILNEIAKKTTCTIVLNVVISENHTGDRRPRIRDFVWSRNIAEVSDQLIGLYRPEYFNVVEDEDGNSTKGRIDLLDMKKREGSSGYLQQYGTLLSESLHTI